MTRAGEARHSRREAPLRPTRCPEQVFNWDLLGPTYVSLPGISAFEPTPEQVVGFSTHLVTAGHSYHDVWHYFLSGARRAPTISSPRLTHQDVAMPPVLLTRAPGRRACCRTEKLSGKPGGTLRAGTWRAQGVRPSNSPSSSFPHLTPTISFPVDHRMVLVE